MRPSHQAFNLGFSRFIHHAAGGLRMSLYEVLFKLRESARQKVKHGG